MSPALLGTEEKATVTATMIVRRDFFMIASILVDWIPQQLTFTFSRRQASVI